MLGVIYNSFSSYREEIVIDCQGPMTVNKFIAIGDGSRITIRQSGSLIVGHAFIGPRFRLFSDKKITIGNGISIAWDVMILDTSFHKIVGTSGVAAEVVIEDDVWIGANVIILPGARIRRGSVVGAGSVVTKSFDEEAVLLAGNPAKIVKRNIDWEL